MHLKVGELACRTGLTVRTLHHYDDIGLLRPSARSPAGYRLYSSADVARLHGIQALRHLGVGLKDIRAMLSGEGPSIPGIVDKQLHALDREIEHATELRERLRLLKVKLDEGTQPGMDEWLGTISLMSTYARYFSAAELKAIFDGWKRVKDDWGPLRAQVREAMQRGVPADGPEIQPLAQRWMNLMARWMGDDLPLMARWGVMHREEPGTRTAGAPELDMIDYMDRAIQTRMAVLSKYFDVSQLVRMSLSDEAAWRELTRAVQSLIRRGAPVGGAAARAQVARWSALLHDITQGDARMLRNLTIAFRDEPLLRTTSRLPPEVRDYLLRAQEALDAKAA